MYSPVEWSDNDLHPVDQHYYNMRFSSFLMHGDDLDVKMQAMLHLRNACLDKENTISDTDEDILKLNAVEFCSMFEQKKQQYLDLHKDIDELEKKKEGYEKCVMDIDTSLRAVNMPYEDARDIAVKVHKVSHERIEALQLNAKIQELKQRQSYMDVMRAVLKQMKGEIGDAMNENNNCPICMDKEAAYVVVPCGHVMCGYCKSRVKQHCFVCRAPLEKTIKLYL
jgi:hypothetical protein